MIRMCGVRLVDWVSIDVLRDRVGVLVKIKDMINQSCLRWYGHEEGSTKEIVRNVLKKGLEQYSLRREDAYDRKKWQEQIRAKITNSGRLGQWH